MEISITENKIKGISIYPNPTVDCFQVSGLDDSIATLIISDLSCKIMLKKEILEDETVSISDLRNGVYIAKITTKKGSIERKLVKNKPII